MADRTQTGSLAQDNFAKLIKLFGATDVSIADVGKKDVDVSFSINNRIENAEIKNSSSLSAINAFDVTVYRSAAKTSRSKDISFIDELVYDFTNHKTLESYIDKLREQDKTIGYHGDEGVVTRGGFMPVSKFAFQPNSKVISTLRDHWSNDNYFVVVVKEKFYIFNTRNSQGELSKNIERIAGIKIPVFNASNLKRIAFQTYGGMNESGKGRMRLQLSLNLSSPTYIENNQNLRNKVIENIYRR